jgi:hypothetical protein
MGIITASSVQSTPLRPASSVQVATFSDHALYDKLIILYSFTFMLSMINLLFYINLLLHGNYYSFFSTKYPFETSFFGASGHFFRPFSVWTVDNVNAVGK